MCLNRHCNSNRKLFQVSDTDIKRADAKQLGTALCIAVQADRGTPAAQLHYFHLAPGDAMDAGAQGFADGLLGGKTSRQSRCFATALPYFRFCVDSPQETLAVTLEDLAHSLYFNDIDTHSDIDTLGRTQRRWQSGQSRRAKEPARDSKSRPAHQWSKEQRQVFSHYFPSLSLREGCQRALLSPDGRTVGAGPIPRPMAR